MSNERKYIVPKKAEVVLSVENVESAISDALSVISTEINKFKNKVNKGMSLALPEARVFQGYIKSLVELSKEAREKASEQDLANMSNEDLLKFVEEIVKREQK